MDDDDLEEMRRLRRSRGYADDRPTSYRLTPGTADSFSESLHAYFGVAPANAKVSIANGGSTSESIPRAMAGDFQVPSAPPPLNSTGYQISADARLVPASINDDDDDDFGPALPPSLSQKTKAANDPSLPSPPSMDSTAIDDYGIPVSHEFVMKGHTKAVSSMALDRAGSRLITGGYDYMLRFWDFNGMDRRSRAFREVEADEGHQIVNIAYNAQVPNRVLVVTASSRPLIYDRDGKQISEFARGDMYLRDMKNTAGHICGCVGKGIK